MSCPWALLNWILKQGYIYMFWKWWISSHIIIHCHPLFANDMFGSCCDVFRKRHLWHFCKGLLAQPWITTHHSYNHHHQPHRTLTQVSALAAETDHERLLFARSTSPRKTTGVLPASHYWLYPRIEGKHDIHLSSKLMTPHGGDPLTSVPQLR